MVTWYNCSAIPDGGEVALGLFQRVVYTPVFVIGLTLNVCALYLFSRAHQWTVIHIYMLNLILADFLLILFLPFRIFETFCAITPTFFCTFLICVHYNNMYVSIFTIMAISVHRFVVIRFPMWTKTLESKRKIIARVVCALIWVVVTVLCVIFGNNLKPQNLRKCFELGHGISTAFLIVLELCGYLLPVVTIAVCSTQAICTLRKSVEDNLNKESVVERKRVVAVIMANMIVFVVCFTPIHLGYLLKHLDWNTEVNFAHAFFEVGEWIATTNCCLDSVGYYFLLKHVFRVKGQAKSCSSASTEKEKPDSRLIHLN